MEKGYQIYLGESCIDGEQYILLCETDKFGNIIEEKLLDKEKDYDIQIRNNAEVNIIEISRGNKWKR